MNIAKSLFRYMYDPDYRFRFNVGKGRTYNKMPDDEYLKRQYRAMIGKELKLENPVTFNEKMQWLKIHDRNPSYTQLVDKIEVKEYISQTLGKEYLIPTLAVWNNADEINYSILPNQFVLKCSHDSHGLIICKDKEQLDKVDVTKRLSKALKSNYYYKFREWPYKNVQPRVFAEQYMSNNGEDLVDYKIHCFNGIPKVVLVCAGRFSLQGLTEDFFDCDWNHLCVKRPTIPNAENPFPKPKQLDKMLEIARILSDDIPFLRVDLYIINQQIYFGELTFYPASGYGRFIPDSFDHLFGDYLLLPQIESK